MAKGFEFGSQLLFAGLLAGSIVIPEALTQAAQGMDKPGATPTSSPVPAASPALPLRLHPMPL
jgi:hypothetical protein